MKGQRVRVMIDEGSSVLNRELGALRARPEEPLSTAGANWCEPTLLLVLAGGLATACSAVWSSWPSQEYLLVSDPEKRKAGLTRVAGIPLVCAALNYLVRHIRQTTFWWEDRRVHRGRCGVDPLSLWPMLLAVLVLLRSACLKLIAADTTSEEIAFYFEALIRVIVLRLYYALLDQIDSIVKGMIQEQKAINGASPVEKMQTLVKNVTRSGRKEKDAVYCFAETNTVPAKVLSYVWSLYYLVGKVLGAGITLIFFAGVDASVSSHFFLGGVAVSALTASGFLFELGPNTLSLFRLSLNKPFYVGDLVTLNKDGAMNSMANSVTGFVENITMMYVVIRNFGMKQTWIPHKEFSGLIIQNWTRRPSKTVLLNIGVSCRCPVKKVQQLVNFGMRWIESSPEIQQQNYRKCHITKTGNGFNIEIIFFPGIGVSHRGIRQKFLVAFMGAAERLQIPFVPVQIAQNFCDERATCSQGDADGAVGEDVALDDLLPDPNDFLPKGVGLGFKQFPEGCKEVSKL